MMLFDEMDLNESILRAVKELGFQEPTPVQEKVIPRILNNKQDLISLAQTGTGKTAAFGLPLIQQADTEIKSIQSLVLCPTRELCIQISSDLKKFSKYIEDFRVIPVYGGANIDTQIRSLKKGGQIVVGTPGRVLDLIGRKILKVNKIEWLVLDEADEMLNMGFKEELDKILEGTPEGKQTLLFSATMPKEIRRISNQYMHEPEEISVGTKNAGAENVKHEYYVAHAKNRYEALKRIADMNPDIYGIVFCRTRQETKDVANKFMNDGYNADALHGDLSQSQRDYVMNRFRNRHLQMLVATDVAARGLDVNNLTHVINYNLPDDLDAYIHRSGRTGRAGKSGISISIVHTREFGRIKSLERITKKPFQRKPIPGGKEICKKQLFHLIDKVEKVDVSSGQIDEFLPEISRKLDWISKEDLIKHFVSYEFNRFLSYYKEAPDLNVDTSSGRDKTSTVWDKKKNTKKSRKDFSRFHINLGSKNNINATRLIGLILEETKNRQIDVGKIDIMKGFSFFEVDKQSESDVLKAFSGDVTYSGRKVTVDLSRPESAVDRYRETSYKGKRGSNKKRTFDDENDFDFKKKGSSDYKKKGNSDFKKKGKKAKKGKKKHRGQS
ncbi:MAG: DEAD/DEAH box helicase [Bacteroidota bacterium]